MKTHLPLFLLIIFFQLFFMPRNIYAQKRKGLIYEYKKMITNDYYLGISFPKNINEYNNKDISDLLEKAWIKKQIIILLQMQNYLENPVCYILPVTDSIISSALNKLKQEKLIEHPLTINQEARDILWNSYINDAVKKPSALPYILDQNNIKYKNADIFIQIFKKELELQIYAKPAKKDTCYTFIKSYEITNTSVAQLGPKTKQGDCLTPEGIYSLNFYPAFKWSDFYLAFIITYPNNADYIRREYWGIKTKAGGNINMHGCCASIGCVPIGNLAIEEIFFFIRSNQMKSNEIDVHIYPFKFDLPDNSEIFEQYKNSNKKICDFWEGLKEIYQYFNRNKKIPDYRIDNETGYYKISNY